MSNISFVSNIDDDEEISKPNVSLKEESPVVENMDRYLNLSCLAVARHIQVCPLCSQFYKCDKRLQHVLIVVLLLVIVFLVKSLLKL
jgi:hypothetical protein